jgi:hypothetical protein
MSFNHQHTFLMICKFPASSFSKQDQEIWMIDGFKGRRNVLKIVQTGILFKVQMLLQSFYYQFSHCSY